MSVCVAVKVGEGLVFASDSATTVAGAPASSGGQQGPQGIVKVFYNATKIFQIDKLPVGVMTWGAGSFKARTIASLIEEFENQEEIKQLKASSLEVGDLAKTLWDFLNKKSDEFFSEIPKQARPQTGLILAGYSGDNFFPEEYLMAIPMQKPRRVREDVEGQPNFGANWYGMTDAIIRFHHGRADEITDILNELEIDSDTIDKFENRIQQDIQYKVLFHAMPLGDAIDYARFLIDLTIARFRFVVGAELCGGPVDIATITRKSGFSWISHNKSEYDIKSPKIYKTNTGGQSNE
ncbi:MAG: hypothetical protein K9N46_15185 [Candidatus Marinimicrobia bacterium]|nr:hypothetical protein [Candidatus Neomarinimicrobiota bacterium]MCF7830190.1 hypothetical protein [Candidatus Neomarinimicrobiota bacterium]MCF7882076.1 hypothetical protein [Candidatus Neomarinimicrobiota bacterium]